MIAPRRATVGPRLDRSGWSWTEFPFPRVSALVAGLLILAAWIAFGLEVAARPGTPATAESTLAQVGRFGAELAGIGARETPAFLRPERWLEALRLAVDTLAMSVLAAALAGGIALPTLVFAAHNVAFGSLRPSPSAVWPALYLIVRAIYLASRSVPELLWALIVIFVFTPGIVPGAIALGIHNLGILGKLGAEVVEDLDVRPIRALQRSGASSLQILAHGILPAVLPRFLTFLLYRWEVIIRTTIVVGLVGAGGLGREFRLAMSWFHYTEVTLLLLVYLLLVFGVDLIAAGLRRLAR